MTRCTDLLSSLHRRGVTFWLEDDRLRYRASKGALAADDLAALRTMRDEAVELLRQRYDAMTRVAPDATGRPAESAPVTVQQAAMLQALDRGRLSLLNPSALRVVGALQPEVLRASFEELVRRHDSLRTHIVTVDGVPRQRIAAPGQHDWQVLDLAHAPASQVSATVQAVVDEIAHDGCDLAVDPLFETRLLRLGEQEHLLCWAIHHIISDGFSFDLMHRELWRIYGELTQPRADAFRQPATQYADYALWQQRTLRIRAQENDSYWEQRLGDAEGIRWPTEARTPASEHEPYATATATLGPALSSRLRELASQSATTMGTVALTIYVATLSQWCRQEDFVIGMAVHGRDRPEFENMTGYCAYDLLLRLRLAQTTSFVDLMNQVAREFQLALAHQDFGRSTARRPELLAHTLFHWLPWDISKTDQRVRGLAVDWFPTTHVATNDTLTLCDVFPTFTESDEGILIAIYCRASLLSGMERFTSALHATAERLGRDLRARVRA